MADKWTPEQIENHIAEAVRQTTPDKLEELMSGLDAPVPADPEVLQPKRRSNRIWKGTAGLAAAFVLLVTGFAMLSQNRAEFAVIGLDVNPSIELSVNKKEQVLSVHALNPDAEALLFGNRLKGKKADEACRMIVSSLIEEGYLTDTSNSILLSVRAEEEDRGRKMELDLSAGLNEMLSDSAISAAILGEYVIQDETLSAFASEHGISLGKALLIQNLLKTNSSSMTEESLLKLSTQELILLALERKVPSSSSYGTADTSRYIGKEAAENIALQNAGLERSLAEKLRSEFDCDDGRIVYEVEFSFEKAEYEYEIDALSGEILSSETEGDGAPLPASVSPAAESDDDPDEDLYDEDDDDFDEESDADDDDDASESDDYDDLDEESEPDDYDDYDDASERDDYDDFEDEEEDFYPESETEDPDDSEYEPEEDSWDDDVYEAPEADSEDDFNDDSDDDPYEEPDTDDSDSDDGEDDEDDNDD